MSAMADTVHTPDSHVESYEERTKRNRLGLWLFLFSEIFLFGALLAARFYLWGNTRPALNEVLGLITSSVLLVSSFFMAWSESAISFGDRKTSMRNMLITAGLGVLFLISVVGFEWGGELRPTDGVYGAVFYMMTGMHALHVLSGVILILINWNLMRKGNYSAGRHWGIEATAVYWHYVDVVWVFFYPALYLIGQPVHL
jgi:cytochrome c oxidase subunit 3